MKNIVYERAELLYGLIKLAEECEDVSYWAKKAKESKDLIELDCVNEYECKIENHKTKMRVIVGDHQAELIWKKFGELMTDLADEKYEDFEDVRIQNIPVAYGVVKDYTLLTASRRKPKVKIKVNFEEYIVKEDIHFFMEYFYRRSFADSSLSLEHMKIENLSLLLDDLKYNPVLMEKGRNIKHSRREKMEELFHNDEMKFIQNELFGECEDGKLACVVNCWDNMINWDIPDEV